MKPAFALNLTPEGISLLHRTSRGWLLVGAVALDDPDMAAAMGYLRKTALGLAPQGFATKLILPASQILYTSVEAPGPDAANRRRQIARALEGRTPYAPEDLVFDWSGTGGRVNVAVVARETLEEAEAFAQEHRFNAVSFVAMPEDGAFAGEPFFGQTAKARSYIPDGERLVRDQDPVRIAGDADLSRLTESLVEAVSEAAAPEAEAPVSDVPERAAPDDGADVAAMGDAGAEELSAEAETGSVDAPSEGEVAPLEEAAFAMDAEAVAGSAPVEPVAEAELPEPAAEQAVEAPDSAAETAAETPMTAEEAPAPEPIQEPTQEPAAEPAPLTEYEARAARRRARAERRNREAADLAEAEAAAARARQASFGFVTEAAPGSVAPAEGPASDAPDGPTTADGAGDIVKVESGADPAFAHAPGSDAPAADPALADPALSDAPTFAGEAEPAEPVFAHKSAPAAGPAPTEGDAAAPGSDAPVADPSLAGAPVPAAEPAPPEDEAEAPFVAIEDEAEEAGAAPAPTPPPPPALDEDGVPTPFAAAATLSPEVPLAGPRLRLGTVEPARSGPGTPPKGDAGSVISPRLGIAAEPRHDHRAEAAKTKARASGLGKAVIAAGKMAKAAKSARPEARRVEAAPGAKAPRARATDPEAEALTVFGARRAAPVRGKPRHLGLILTLVLVFLMVAVALWSRLLDDGPAAEAPGAALQPARTTGVDSLVDGAAFEDVASGDAAVEGDADAMTEAEIAADGGYDAMGAPDSAAAEDGGEDAAGEAIVDLPVDLPEDLPEEDLPEALQDQAPADAREIANAADALAEESAAPEATDAAPDAAAAAAIADAGVAGGAGSQLAAADVATTAPAVPAEAASGPQPDATEGLPPRPTDPAVSERSAEALPETDALTADALPQPPQPPLPYGTDFEFDANGLVVATPDGALTPDGVMVVAGAPAQVPPPRPADAAPPEPEAEAATEADPAPPVADPALAGLRPQPRPASLEVPADAAPATDAPAPEAEDGAALAPPAADPALAGFRPRAASDVAVAAASAARSAEEARAAEQAALQAELASATASAVASSRKPASRPQDFSQGIEAALAIAATTAPVIAAAAPATVAPVATPAPAPAPRVAAAAPAPEPEELDEPEPVAAAPSIPTSASVAKQATISGAISLREINLIGIYGASSSRRALVRLSNGRMLRVKIGDRIDGGQVTAIGEGQLTYVKGGRTHVLRMIQQS